MEGLFKARIQEAASLSTRLSPGGQTGYLTSTAESSPVNEDTVMVAIDNLRQDVPDILASEATTELVIKDPNGREPFRFRDYRISQIFGTSDSGKLAISDFNPQNEIIMADCLNAGSRNISPVVVSAVRLTRTDTNINQPGAPAIDTDTPIQPTDQTDEFIYTPGVGITNFKEKSIDMPGPFGGTYSVPAGSLKIDYDTFSKGSVAGASPNSLTGTTRITGAFGFDYEAPK